MKWTAIILALFLVGCAYETPIYKGAYVRSENQKNLLGLKVGMTYEKVLEIMGTGTVVDEYFDDVITNPWRTETMTDDAGNQCLIVFYYTDIKARDGAVTDDELTPLVLVDEELVGWGWHFLGEKVAKYRVEFR